PTHLPCRSLTKASHVVVERRRKRSEDESRGSPRLAVIFNGGGLRVGGSQRKADCRATRHRFTRRSTSSFRYTARAVAAGAQSKTNVEWPAQPARGGGGSLSEFRCDPISI